MLSILVVALVSLAPLVVTAQASPAPAPNDTIPDDVVGAAPALRPYLLALSVEDLDASVEWYAGMLGFGEAGRYEFAADRMRLAFLKREGFELELIEIADAPPFSAPDPANPATRRGLVKFAFYSSEIGDLYTSVVEAGARVQSPMRNSNRTGGRFFILLDPDGNWVQVFGPGA